MKWRYAIAGIGLIAVAVVGFLAFDWQRPVLELVEWTRDRGTLGVLVFSAAYVLLALLLLPGSLLTLGAGFAYGPWYGSLLVSPVSVLTATVAFVLGRSVLREWVARKIAERQRFQAIDQAIGKNGFKVVLLLRLSPVLPFALLNYGLGITRVKLSHYVLGSWLGMAPATVLYVYLGSLVTNASQLLSQHREAPGPYQQALYWGGLAATLIVTVLLTQLSRRELRRILDEPS